MTPAQLVIFKGAINGNVDAPLVAVRNAGNLGAVADYYNAPATGFIWRQNVAASELITQIDWAAFAALTVQKQNTYVAMTQGQGLLDATASKVRGGFVAVFGAVGTATTDALILLAQRPPTRFEALFTVANVCTVFGTQVSVADVVAALGS